MKLRYFHCPAYQAEAMIRACVNAGLEVRRDRKALRATVRAQHPDTGRSCVVWRGSQPGKRQPWRVRCVPDLFELAPGGGQS